MPCAVVDVALERLGIGAGAEPAACPGQHHDTHLGVVLGLLQAPSVFGVHAAGPGVQAVGAIESDGRDAVGDLVGGGLQFHGEIVVRVGRLPTDGDGRSRARR